MFNAAQMVVALSIGGAILHSFGQGAALWRGRTPDLVWFPLAVAAGAAVLAVNALLTYSVVALHQHLPVGSLLREHGTDNLPTDGMLLLLSPVFVIVAERSLPLVPPLLVVVWMVFRSAKEAHLRRHEASHDALTGLSNRRVFEDRLARALHVAKRRNELVGVMLIDLDEFKHINDSLGHGVGDQVLAGVAKRLASACRPADVLVRLGGDEFAAVLPDVSSVDTAGATARRLIASLHEPLTIDGFPVTVRASGGVAVFPDHGEGRDSLLRRADQAMCAAKTGHGGVSVYRPDHQDASIGRMSLLADLAKALDGDQLFLEYQPQVALASRVISSVEVLVRWDHPTVGIIQPAAFMSIAEHTELIGPLTGWILRAALSQCARWRDDGRHLRVAMNVSVRNLQDVNFAGAVERALAKAGIDASSLVLEITEHTVGLERKTIRTVLADLHDMGVSVAIDDFDTRFSSILQLRDLPVDRLKLDRRFVSNMARDANDALIVRAILQLSSALGIETIAEGVDDPLVADLLRDFGCDMAQGYLFARPMGADDLISWIDSVDPWHLPLPSLPGPGVPTPAPLDALGPVTA